MANNTGNEAGPIPCGVVPCVLPMHDVNGTHLDPDGNEFTIDVCGDCGWQDSHAPDCAKGCGLVAIYVPGYCVLPRRHRGDHRTIRGEQFTRGNWPGRLTDA